MRQTLCAAIASIAAALSVAALPSPAVAAPKLPPAADSPAYEDVSEETGGAGEDASQVDLFPRAPLSTVETADDAIPAPPLPKPPVKHKPATGMPHTISARTDSTQDRAAEPSVSSRRRQPQVQPSAPPEAPVARSSKAKIVAPGAPSRAARPMPPSAPSEEIDDSGVGTGADAPVPQPADSVPSLTESINKSPTRSTARPSELGSQQLNPQMIKLRHQIRSVLGYYHQKHLNTRDHDPWEVMHSIVAYGAASQLDRPGSNGEPVNAICWMCWNGDCQGIRILDIEDGRVAARRGPKVQGHPGQFLAILAQSRVATNCPMKVKGQEFILEDLIESEKLGCRPKTELTFKLISLAYYLKIDERWKSSDGQDWSIDRLVQEELSQPIVGAACGGTHRLMGLAYAVRKRETSGLPVTGEFARARKFLDDYHRYAFKLQNADGSFSTEWFKGPGSRPDLPRRIQTSGHILEWLSYSLPADQLDHPRVVKSITYLSGVLHSGKGEDWSVGPLGHALHALAIYDDRYFRQFDPPSDTVKASEIERIVPTSGLEEADETGVEAEQESSATSDESESQPKTPASAAQESRVSRINLTSGFAPSRTVVR